MVLSEVFSEARPWQVYLISRNLSNFRAVTPRITLSECHRRLNHHDHVKMKTEAITIYKWPTMKHFYVISRLKLYQLSAMAVLLGPLTYWYKEGAIALPLLIYGYSAAMGTAAVLCALSYGFSKVIGEIAFTDATGEVCISTLSFFGNRRREYYSLEQIVPYADTERKGFLGVIQRLETLHPRRVYYYNLRYGKITDHVELMKKVLGMYSFPVTPFASRCEDCLLPVAVQRGSSQWLKIWSLKYSPWRL